jgi:hypothetical protein
MASVIPVAALVFRLSGHWTDDDFYAGGWNIGRIFKAEAGHPQETPWMWTIVFHERKPPGPHQGFAVSREQAMTVFKASWERGRVNRRPLDADSHAMAASRHPSRAVVLYSIRLPAARAGRREAGAAERLAA